MRDTTARTLATGMVAGGLGFAIVTLGLAASDLFSSRGLGFTPSLLTAGLLEGVTAVCDVQVAWQAVLAYSAIHLVVFLALGWLTAVLFQVTAMRPWFWLGAVLAFIFVVFHLYGAVITILAGVRGCVSLYQALGTTTIASIAMVAYLVRENREVLAAVTRPENQ